MVRKFKAVVNELQVLRAQGGDEQAFRELVETWSPYLLRFCQSRTDNADIALEVVQAVWLQVVKGLRRLHDPARFPAWLFTIAARACADQVRVCGSSKWAGPSTDVSGPLQRFVRERAI